jgi:hypothetical protein
MTAEQFTYWLQGFFELSRTTTLNEQQVKIVKDHIALVLNKATPRYDTTGKDVIYVKDDRFNQVKAGGTFNQIKADTILDINTHLSC